ncbi:fructose-bisphosphatase class III, partial [Mammaliicoccus fleurettii]|nr:fructose-bisphosphatase class III [Mammaliicoccus fleurettii]
NLKEKYLNLLAEKFDEEEKVATEIINLQSILDLPKGTEHFVSDLHGEYHAFQHVLRNGSGNVRAKIHDIFKDTHSEEQISELAALVYYPEEKLKLIKNQFETKADLNDWYIETIQQMIHLISYASSKY